MINSTASLESPHFPVMLDEIINICIPSKGGNYVDCTFGGGGYSRKFLQFPNINLQAFDRDENTKIYAKELQKRYPKTFKFYHKKFSEIDTVNKNKLIDIIIFDLGLSSI